MPRSKPHLSTAAYDEQIAELLAARDAEVAKLFERRREAERGEHLRRGTLLASYLAGPHGATIRAALSPVVAPRDRALFGLTQGTPSNGIPAEGLPPHR